MQELLARRLSVTLDTIEDTPTLAVPEGRRLQLLPGRARECDPDVRARVLLVMLQEQARGVAEQLCWNVNAAVAHPPAWYWSKLGTAAGWDDAAALRELTIRCCRQHRSLVDVHGAAKLQARAGRRSTDRAPQGVWASMTPLDRRDHLTGACVLLMLLAAVLVALHYTVPTDHQLLHPATPAAHRTLLQAEGGAR